MADETGIEQEGDASARWRIEVGNRLADLRRELEQTDPRAKAAEYVSMKLLGLGQNAVGNWERGEAVPGGRNLLALATLYKRSTDWILGLSEEPQIPPDHAIINSELERAVLGGTDIDEIEKEALDRGFARRDADGAVILNFGYSVPTQFQVLTKSVYEARITALHETLAELTRRKSRVKGKRENDGKQQQQP